MSATAQIPLPVPMKDERQMAMLAHVLQLFGGFIAPLIIFIVKRESKFVRFHALQPLIWQVCVIILSMVFVFILMGTMIFTIPMEAQPKSAEPPVAFFVMFGGMWLLIGGSWVANIILAIFYGIKANEGAWSRYPLIGRLAAKWAGV